LYGFTYFKRSTGLHLSRDDKFESVDLPAPFGPTIPTIPRRRYENVRLSNSNLSP
jgi:hypothetical protein